MIDKGKRIVIDTVVRFYRSGGSAMASHVALSMIMALFPFLIFVVSLAGFIGIGGRSEVIVDLVFETWPEEVAHPISQEINAVLAQTNAGFLSLGIGLAIYFASNGIEAVRLALNRAYQVTEGRSFIYCQMQSILFVFCGAGLLFVISFLMLLAPQLYSLAVKLTPQLADFEGVLDALRYLVSIAALMFAVFACHVWLPAQRHTVTRLWPGILATLILWLIAAGLFTLYLGGFADHSATFAGLAGIMSALIFLYLMAAILVLGGELNAALMADSRPSEMPAEFEPE